MSELRVGLYRLMGEYSLQQVYREFMTIMREEYEFLTEFYSTAPPSPEKKTSIQKKNTKIKVDAEETPSHLLQTDISANSISPETSDQQKNTPPETSLQPENILLQVSGEQKTSLPEKSVEQKSNPPETSGDQKKVQVISGEKKNYLSREEEKEKKREHDLKVKVKRDELLSKSVVPEQMLTKEKMEGWISSGWTYWKIAEETGCSDTYVSSMAKGFGLKRMSGNNVYVKRIS